MTVLDRFKLDGRRALVTGGSRGLGLSMALALAEAGADVAVSGRDAESLGRAANAIRSRGRQAWTLQGDMSKPVECEALCEQAVAEFGPIDILINNVGDRGLNIAIEDTPLETWQHFVDLNLTHCFLATKIIGGAMIKRGQGGAIINTASISGMIANKGIAGRHYETTKAAVIHFTRCTAADWAPHNIRVNAICPGLFMTDPNRAWSEKPGGHQDLSFGRPDGPRGRARGIGTAGGLPGVRCLVLRHRRGLRDRWRIYSVVMSEQRT